MARKKASDCGCPFARNEPDDTAKPRKGASKKAAFSGKKAPPFPKKGKGK